MRKTKLRPALLALTLIISIALLATSCKRPPNVIVPDAEWGHIEYFGQIIDSHIPPDLAAKLAGKTVAVISQAALNDYMLLKTYAKKHNLNYK